MCRMTWLWLAGCERLGLLLLASCSSGPAQSATGSPVPTPAGTVLSRHGEVFSREQLEETAASMLYDAIRRHRPLWLERRTTRTAGDPLRGFPAVYLERMYAGSLEKLRDIPTSTVAEVRYLSSSGAREWLGVSHPGGVIVIYPRRKG
jgi:hypothetical protein